MSDGKPAGLSHQYLLSLPERALRSMSALSAGLLRELSEVVLPRAVRRTRLYTELVENTLRFLIENVGQVEGAIRRKASWRITSRCAASRATASS
jgi:hypothetical protein